MRRVGILTSIICRKVFGRQVIGRQARDRLSTVQRQVKSRTSSSWLMDSLSIAEFSAFVANLENSKDHTHIPDRFSQPVRAPQAATSHSRLVILS